MGFWNIHILSASYLTWITSFQRLQYIRIHLTSKLNLLQWNFLGGWFTSHFSYLQYFKVFIKNFNHDEVMLLNIAYFLTFWLFEFAIRGTQFVSVPKMLLCSCCPFPCHLLLSASFFAEVERGEMGVGF